MTVEAESPTIDYAGAELLDRPTILFVDDDPSMVSSIERSFRPWDVELEVALHGMQGIMQAIKIRPDVIITDLQMPFASGEELIDCLSKNEFTHGVPLIVVTGRCGVKLTARLESQGVVAVFQKPFDFTDLIDTLSNIIPIRAS